jgi:hypothetical protein
MPRRAKSKAQARYLGAVAGGRIKPRGLSAPKAREMLRGTRMKRLPARKSSSSTRRKRRGP